MLKIKEIFLKYKNILKEKNFETYSLDIEVLLMEVTGFSKIKLYTNTEYCLKKEEFEKFEYFFKRRLKNEPIAYIIGKCEFMGLEFNLNSDTLIPRPDTEILVEKAIDIIKNKNLKKCLDIGTGSGAIAISIAKYCNEILMTAIDINENAILKATENAQKNGVLNKINFLKSNLFEKINEKYDIIVSNPPYIKTNLIEQLEENVKKYEPRRALDGGQSGLIFYEKITKNCKDFLNENAYIIYEIGHDQAEEVKKIMLENNFINIEILKDLAGLDRVILGKFKGD